MSKKTIMSGFLAIAMVAVVGMGINKSVKAETNISDLALSNVEALAQNEGGGKMTINCRYGSIAKDPNEGTFNWLCSSCTYVLSNNLSYNSSTCTYYY